MTNKIEREKYAFTFARELYESATPFALTDYVERCLSGDSYVDAGPLIQIVLAYHNLVRLYGTREIDVEHGAVRIDPIELGD